MESAITATLERAKSVEASAVAANERIRGALVTVDTSVTRRRQREAVVADALEAAGDVRAAAVLADGGALFGALINVKTITA